MIVLFEVVYMSVILLKDIQKKAKFPLLLIDHFSLQYGSHETRTQDHVKWMFLYACDTIPCHSHILIYKESICTMQVHRDPLLQHAVQKVMKCALIDDEILFKDILCTKEQDFVNRKSRPTISLQ